MPRSLPMPILSIAVAVFLLFPCLRSAEAMPVVANGRTIERADLSEKVKTAGRTGDRECRSRNFSAYDFLSPGGPLKQFQQKCKAVLRPEFCKNKELERLHASFKTGNALETPGPLPMSRPVTAAPAWRDALRHFEPLRVSSARDPPAF